MTSQAKKTYTRFGHHRIAMRPAQPGLQDPDDGTLSFGPRSEDHERHSEGMPRMRYRPINDANLARGSNLGFCLTSEDLETSPDYFERNIEKMPGFGRHTPHHNSGGRGVPNCKHLR
ncbi:hypothetical protein GCM10007901_39600 [Dyella acidisoli]|uniref:Uncharacterized protein n=1 Tax=Dyella acidisoli TaxID=1867834 RepID=A0ABQ5XUK6_9GAMM|nr:hypothetical protein GCM10007901_39600 [Dyella acidisoli]